LPEIEASECVLFIDAINTGSAPGTIAVVERAELPRYFERKLSPHQVDLREVLAICELRGTLPRVTVAFGAQPEVIEMSTSLSPALAAKVDAVADLVAGRLALLGHDVRRRQPAAA
jgi:hydrogenase maturation protease